MPAWGADGRPVLDSTVLDGFYFLNLTLPRNADEVPKALEQAAGLVPVPTRQEIDFTIIKPAKDESPHPPLQGNASSQCAGTSSYPTAEPSNLTA